MVSPHISEIYLEYDVLLELPPCFSLFFFPRQMIRKYTSFPLPYKYEYAMQSIFFIKQGEIQFHIVFRPISVIRLKWFYSVFHICKTLSSYIVYFF